MQTRQVRLLISGLVQGVCYRASAQRQAQSLGLRGWVRNLRTGQVELVAQGPHDDVEALVAWCRRGPPAARVHRVDIHEEQPETLPPGFTIRATS
ncbi:MAG: acylphosphatase [Myxococcales bacterium]|nr:acylphosphatase [Myxococcota bacterium]MDW8283884.1 acylphosphatase [Myxococcales bacterium]